MSTGTAKRALRIGISGHRPDLLPHHSQTEIRAKLDRLLPVIRESAPGVETFAIVSALAEGADRIVAEAGLATGFCLDVVLPVPAAVYETVFDEPQSKAEFRSLLAEATTCVVLPGEKRLDDPAAAIRAFEAAGLAVLAASDLLITVWNGLPARSQAGTGAMVRRALAQGMPVLRFDQSAGGPACWDSQAQVSLVAEAAPDDVLRRWLTRRLAQADT